MSIEQVSPVGIIRNEYGRILSTGWPIIPVELWEKEFIKIWFTISSQIRFEEHLLANCQKEPYTGAYQDEVSTFNLNSCSLFSQLISTVQSFSQLEKISVLDLGCGGGEIIQKLFFKLSKENFNTGLLACTLTTLVLHEVEKLERLAKDPRVEEVSFMAVELPKEAYYEKFDIILAQNSVFFWSNFPELAVLNMWKMLKEGGIVIANFPDENFSLGRESFNIRNYLEQCDLFEPVSYEETNNYSISQVKLKKINSSPKSPTPK